MKRLAILGASGHGKVVADAAIASGWREILFFDDAWPALEFVGPWPVTGTSADLMKSGDHVDAAIVAIGDNQTRLKKIRQISAMGIPLASIVHPAASVSSHAKIGAGSVVFAGAVVNAFAQLGLGCIINTGATIDHDCDLGDGVHASPGANLGGQVLVGAGTWIGIGACVKHCVTIGSNVVIGAGSAVVGDIDSGMQVVGVPARTVER